MARRLKVCADHPLDDFWSAMGVAEAVALRPDNLRVHPLPGRGRRPGELAAAFERLKLWPNGQRLKVAFVDGDPVVHGKVAAVARQWEDHANLRLDFGAHARADIRVSFAEKGWSWSMVGTDARQVHRARATMNYGWLEPGTGDREYQRVVLHEFGHALGMIHEHQNPAARGAIPWDVEKVYAYYAQQGWSRDDVDRNIFDTYDADQTNFSSYDPESIMQYPVPDALTVGSFAIGWNTRLSPLDKEYMRRQYPFDAAGPVRIEIGAPDVPGELGTGFEVDVFTFRVERTGTFIMATTGSTDVVMTLYGPDDPAAMITWDDDRGRAENARIVRKLRVGDYWLHVTHKEPGGTGAYAVGVRRRADRRR